MTYRLMFVVLVAAVVAAAFWLGRESAHSDTGALALPAATDAGDDADPVDQVAISTATGQMPSSPATTVPVAATLTLPPPDAAVIDYFDELLGAARKGDAHAACRLGAELMRCRRHQAQLAFSRNMTRSIGGSVTSTGADDSMINALAVMEERAAREETACAGLESRHLDRALELQLMAAERGGARERLWYASAPALDREFFLENLSEWARYRAVAYGYLEQALAAGDPAAPSALAQVHLPADSGLPGMRTTPLMIPDARKHLVYRELSRLLSPPLTPVASPPGSFSIDDLVEGVDADVDMREIRAEAEQLRQRYYAGVNTESTTSFSSPVGPFFTASPSEICGE